MPDAKNVPFVDLARIRSLAKASGKSLTYLCALIGKKPWFFGDVKKGTNHVDADELSVIADALDTTPEYLTGQTDNPARVTPAANQVLDALTGLTDEQIDMVLAFIAGLKA